METLKADVKEYILDQLKDDVGLDVYGCDLHHELLNTNYFIIGTHKAKEWLKGFTFEAIEKIKEYEEVNFGETYTNLSSPEKVANMLAYVLGSEILADSVGLYHRWDTLINEYSLRIIISELEAKKV